MKKILIALCMASWPAIHFAQKPAVVINNKAGWHKITETVVSYEKETDEVNILLADKFSALKFTVSDAPIELISIDVLFADGNQQQITIGNKIKEKGESSKEIDIDGSGERKIDRIILHYRTVDAKKGRKAHLEIWGKKLGNGTEEKRTEKDKTKAVDSDVKKQN